MEGHVDFQAAFAHATRAYTIQCLQRAGFQVDVLAVEVLIAVVTATAVHSELNGCAGEVDRVLARLVHDGGYRAMQLRCIHRVYSCVRGRPADRQRR